jgi:alpha-glucosidase
VQRVVSRWGKSQNAEQNINLAKMLFAMISSLRGSVCSYQGEELGLTEADIAFEDIQDPYGITFWPQFKGRDGCRTPHPWQHDEINAGFSQAKPWLPVAVEHQDKSVNLQEHSTDSVLNSYRHFTQWRKQHSALLYGDISFIDTPEPILAFIRQDSGEKLLVCFNFSNQAQELSLDLVTDELSVLTDHNLITANVTNGQVIDKKIVLPAFGCFYASL